jgi:hypothetical protein
MAELRPVSGHLGVGPVRAPRGERLRRFVSDGRGGGYWTYQTPEEEAEQERLSKQRHDAIVAQGLAWLPNPAAAAEQQAARERAFDQRWPDPRQSLRDAHQRRNAAEAELARCREQANAASAHTAHCEGEVKRTSQAVEEIRREQAVALRARLAGNGDTAPDDDDPVHAQAMAAAGKAERALAVALSAQAAIAESIQQAQGEVSNARRRIEACAKALCERSLRDRRVELAVLRRQAEVVERDSWQLQRVLDYQRMAEWPVHLRKLLDDPEAPLIENEIKSAVETAAETV